MIKLLIVTSDRPVTLQESRIDMEAMGVDYINFIVM